MSGISEVLLFCASKSINIDDIVLPHLNNGGIIIYDRFNHSTLAYQGYAGGIDLDIINNLCNIATKGLQPDLTFYIDTSL
jgi:dTMP kinase